MKIQIESTETITELDGVQVRRWNGVTEGGIECVVFIHRIGVKNGFDTEDFERELKEQLPPGRFIPLRQVLT